MTREEFEQLKVENYPVTSLNLPQNVEMSRMQGYQKVPRTEMRTEASVVDLLHMEKLDELEDINPLPLYWNQATLKREVIYLTEILTNKEIKIATLKSELQKAVSRGPGTSDGNEQLLQKLRDENTMLLKTNASLSKKVKTLNRQLIKAHKDANEPLFRRILTPLPLPF
ncbi:hypothetical protein KY290_017053 [Solanum tuberosum]|uniref:Uncharacterized protein n=1 Tax=Solanum tuberosum TaxID=4113 RepID=A0ABQ7VA93_SOLTU|nr:hypothetical protein KY284_016119 [Solanum tuberosum]KAH0701835.1 hypothetical protein KY285_016113 [Solanum tuberosum]KAH0760980.1 hypothetical protein KY290_017053 [Solanum tuberosum]